MSDRSELDELSQRLLRSAAADRPSEEARRRTALALGLAAPLPPPGTPSVGSAGSAGSSAVTPAGAAAQGAAGPSLAVASGLPAVPWVAKVVLGLALTAGASAPWWPTGSPSPAPAARPSSESTPNPTSAPPPLAEAPPPVLPAVEVPAAPLTPPSPSRAEARRPTRPPPPPAPPLPATLAEETALLERAHRAWSARDLSAMDQALAEYQRRCPGGRLSREAELLALDRLWLAGDRSAFLAAAQAFERRYPAPGLPPRLRAHLGGPP